MDAALGSGAVGYLLFGRSPFSWLIAYLVAPGTTEVITQPFFAACLGRERTMLLLEGSEAHPQQHWSPISRNSTNDDEEAKPEGTCVPMYHILPQSRMISRENRYCTHFN